MKKYILILLLSCTCFAQTPAGIGGAAGAPSTLIAHWPMNEDTALDNAELVDGGDFATADWVADDPDPTYWTVIGEVTTDPEVSEVGTGEGHGGAGTGMCNIYTSDGTMVYLYQIVTTIVGRKYRVSIDIDTVTAGKLRVEEDSATTWGTDKVYSTTGTKTFTFVAVSTSTLPYILRDVAEVTDITFNNFSIKLCAAEDSSGNDHDMLMQRDTDAIHVTGKTGTGAFDFNGTSDFGEVGDTESDVKSIAMWVNPDDVTAHTDSLIDLNGTDYITIVNGTVTKNGFGTGTQIIYVDGVVASTVTSNWHLVILTSTVGFTADDLDIGREGSNYYDGDMDNEMLFSIELTPDEVNRLYNNNNGTEILAEIDSVLRPRRSNASPLGTRARYEFP